MHVFLVRHGETVDNVAGIYAGSRDSALTSHGVLQARRLASHLAGIAAQRPFTFAYVCSSDLQRAVKTAEAIVREQSRPGVEVQQLECLREKDFGSDEGVRFSSSRARASDTESVESMRERMDTFLDEYFLPVLGDAQAAADEQQPPLACAIVSHGIVLGVLYKALCSRVSRGGITLDPNPSAAGSLLASPLWDNTGYLECVVSLADSHAVADERDQHDHQQLKLHIKTVNCTAHLKDLKKTRGGIGSAAHDEKQKTVTSFFTPASSASVVTSVSRKRKSQDMT